MSLTYLSVCSGIEAASVAWGPLGWKPLAFAEVDAFPSSVLAHHYPDVPNLGDMNAFREWPSLEPDVLVGGTPCQSFSVAGLRKGMADPRGNLALVYVALVERYRPRWVVWENVPGVLSSNEGRDFGSFIGALAELGYGLEWRVLDAQFFGVPQRRRRVFVVGRAGGFGGQPVLFERESLHGHPPPSREAREVAPTTPSRRSGGGGLGTDFDCDGGLITSHDPAVTLTAREYKGALPEADLSTVVAFNSREDMVHSTERFGALGSSSPQAYDMRGRDGGAQLEGPHDTANIRASSGGSSKSYVIQERAVAENPDAGPDGAGFREGAAYTLEARTRVQAVAFKPSHYTRGKDGAPSEVVPPLSADADKGDQDPVVASAMQVRRLTPTECERLQGFPQVSEKVIFSICPATKCTAHASAETPCTTGQNSALSADGGVSPQPVKNAAQSSGTNQADPAPHADLHVLLDSVREVVELRSAGRLIWSVSIADRSSASHLSMPPDAFARLVALTTQTSGKTTPDGRVVSHRNTERSTHLWSGERSVKLSGQEIDGHAAAVEACMLDPQKLSTSTTSPSIASIPTSVSTLTTLCCCVLAAISSSIQPRTQNAHSFSLLIEARGGYTQVPHRNKPAADGPRYKALGNSMAVPVMRWIGERISDSEAEA